jgi:hypothetical protein
MNVEAPSLIVRAVDCGRTIRPILAAVFPSQRKLPDDHAQLVRRLSGRPGVA